MHAKRSSPSALRNKEPILRVLERHLPKTGSALEVASGSGQHVATFAQAFPEIVWVPTDRDSGMLPSIAEWCADMGLSNVRPPVLLDVEDRPWPVASADAVLAINLIHIAPWEAGLALLSGAGDVLVPGGVLYLYGAYKRDGAHTAPSNEEFDGWLKRMDPRFGVRDLEDVVREAERAGLEFAELAPMPANNFSVVFRKPRS